MHARRLNLRNLMSKIDFYFSNIKFKMKIINKICFQIGSFDLPAVESSLNNTSALNISGYC